LGDVGYVMPHELECPLGDPPSGKMVPNNFSKPERGYHMDRLALKIV
jgi:hypothetical protein